MAKRVKASGSGTGTRSRTSKEHGNHRAKTAGKEAGNSGRGGLSAPVDPRKSAALEGPPPAQKQDWPGSDADIRPNADHGEESYRGSGRLKDRVALITGGDSGIGRAVAIAFAREGAHVAIAYFNEDEDANETLRWVRRARSRALAIAGDLTDREHCRSVIARTIERFGRLDILVNNAAYQCEQSDISDVTPEQLARTFGTNIFATFWLCQAALEHMEPGGVIINTGSVTGMEGSDGLLDYSATKGAIHALTKSLAGAVAERGIRVNCVAPGPVWTPLIPATLERDHIAHFGEETFWKRPAQPAEIAPSFVFLASGDGRYYSGEILSPTGRSSSR
jgi:NAD(P)-dependent dehydrogenase (short-subunit alcohol dehydrogenase family)